MESSESPQLVPRRTTRVDGLLKFIGVICFIVGLAAWDRLWPTEHAPGTSGPLALVFLFGGVVSAVAYFAFAQVIRLLDEIRFHLSGELPVQRDGWNPRKKSDRR